MSQEVKISAIAQSLGINEAELFEKLIDWNEKIPFKIKKGYIVVEILDKFVNSLDEQFAEWEQEEREKLEKL
ncbi:MAG: hypothetical protein ACTSVZ_02365 [Promethearchaeota archaeon]